MHEDITVRARVPIPLTGLEAIPSAITFQGWAGSGCDHFALGFPLKSNEPPLVRIHSECVTGDVFGSARCDCGEQLKEALSRISDEGGYILYLRQEGRGIGLNSKMDAYALQDMGKDTFQANVLLGFPADARDFSCAAAMLRALGHTTIRLLTNNPDKTKALREEGLTVRGTYTTAVYSNRHNEKYLKAKKERGHNLTI